MKILRVIGSLIIYRTALIGVVIVDKILFTVVILDLRTAVIRDLASINPMEIWSINKTFVFFVSSAFFL